MAVENEEQTEGREGGKERHTKRRLTNCVDRKERNLSPFSFPFIKHYTIE